MTIDRVYIGSRRPGRGGYEEEDLDLHKERGRV
jgi:hypothetical protein